MIISRTPFRISFFGGGTDYPVWYREHGGSVLATTIDKYCYIMCRPLPPFFEHRSRILYSQIELVKDSSEIQHPAVRETLRYLNIDDGLEIHHDADLPARTGLGSSSTFTVGLLHALHAFQGSIVGKMKLAQEAIHVEHDLLRETVGAQDQTSAAFGGFNRIDFSGERSITVTPVTLKKDRLGFFQDHCMLVFTGFTRTASEIAAEQVKLAGRKAGELRAMHAMVDAALGILSGTGDLAELGRLLHESWRIKKTLSDSIAPPAIDAIYDAARAAGAIGGKLIGAGGGGFMLLFARPEDHARIRKRIKGLLHVPIRFESQGSQIVYYDPTYWLASPPSVRRKAPALQPSGDSHE